MLKYLNILFKNNDKTIDNERIARNSSFRIKIVITNHPQIQLS